MGESKRKQRTALAERAGSDAAPQGVDTLGRRMHVRGDRGSATTSHGPWFFFAEFPAATGGFERWVSAGPLEDRSGKAPNKRDLLGTLMPGSLAAHRRYAHLTALRRALERIDERASAAGIRPALMRSMREALDRPWVRDIDARIQPPHGHLQGAALGDSPSKPGRPRRVPHTFRVGNLRRVLDMQVGSGKQPTSVRRCHSTALPRPP